MSEINQKADQLASQVQSGVETIESKIRQGAEKLNDTLKDDEVQRATKRAEDEVNKLKAELAELRRNVGPKMQEAENYLTSPSAITFYKGLITGIALVLAFKRYAEKN